MITAIQGSGANVVASRGQGPLAPVLATASAPFSASPREGFLPPLSATGMLTPPVARPG